MIEVGIMLNLCRFANTTALKEIYRVLQPTGVLGMIWNIEDCEVYATADLMRTNPPQTTPHGPGILHLAGSRPFETSRGLSTTRNHAFGTKNGGLYSTNSQSQIL